MVSFWKKRLKRTSAGQQGERDNRDLLGRRAAIHQGLVRASVAEALIVMIVLGLAVAAMISARRAERNAVTAREAVQRLWEAYPKQARASRFSGSLGRSAESLQGIAAAARVRPSLELRNEAIATLALFDIQETDMVAPGAGVTYLDPAFTELTVVSDRVIRTFALGKNRELRRTELPAEHQFPIAISPEGRYLAASSSQRDLLVWSIPAGTNVLSLTLGSAGEKSWAIDFNGDASVLVVGVSSKGIRVLSLPEGKEVVSLDSPRGFKDLAVHPTEPLVAISAGSVVEVWNWQSKRRIHSLAHSSDVNQLAWRADGRQLATSCGASIFLWDLPSEKSQSLEGHSGFVSRLLYNHGGSVLVSTSFDGTSRFWEPRSGRLLLVTHRGFACQFSSDDAQVAFQRFDKPMTGIWRVQFPRGARLIATETPVAGLSADFSLDGAVLALMAEDGLHFFDVRSSKPRHLLACPVPGGRSVLFRSNDQLITTGTTGLEIREFECSTAGPNLRIQLGNAETIPLPGSSYIEYSQLTADRTALAIDVGVNAVVVDLDHPEQPRLFRAVQYTNLSAVALSPDKDWLVTGTFHGTGTRVWDAHTCLPVRDLVPDSTSLTFSPDGRWLATGSGAEYRIWNSRTWQCVRTISRDTPDVLVGPCCFSGDVKVLAIAHTQRLIKLVDVVSGEEIAALNSPDPQFINHLAFSHDGNLLAAATSGAGVQLWDLRELRVELARLGLDWGNGGVRDVHVETGTPMGLARRAENGAGKVVREMDDSPRLRALILTGVVLALLSALFVLERHRRLLEGYTRVETEVVARTRDLEIAHAELLHSQKMKALGTLAAGIAHDFNNLLSVIRMSNKLIGRAAGKNAAVAESVSEIEQAVLQGKQVVRSMLGYSRDETESKRTFAVVEVVEDTVALLSKQFLNGITLTLELNPGAPEVAVSRGRLEQALLNLIVNASEVMQGKGRLRLSVQEVQRLGGSFVLHPRSAPKYVELAVGDSGPGIAPEILDRIWEPFFTTKLAGATPGTGLGLSLIYGIAEQDGLGIGLTTSLNHGTTFRLIIPAA